MTSVELRLEAVMAAPNETSDRYSVMAKYSDAVTKWGFILRSCIQYG